MTELVERLPFEELPAVRHKPSSTLERLALQPQWQPSGLLAEAAEQLESLRKPPVLVALEPQQRARPSLVPVKWPKPVVGRRSEQQRLERLEP